MTSSTIDNGRHRLLQHFDIQGMIGGHASVDSRKNVLLDEVSAYHENTRLMIKGFMLQPEGGSSEAFMRGIFSSLPDTNKAKDFTLVAWEGDFVPVTFPKKLLLWQLRDEFHLWRPDQADYCFDSSSFFLPFYMNEHDDLHLFETFGGGYGGWSYASRVVQKHAKVPMQTVTLDSDFTAIKNFAMQHNCSVIDGSVRLPIDALSASKGHVVIHAHIQSCEWWEAVRSWGVDIMSISAPCPPWSNASTKAGLGCAEGLLLPHCLLLLRIFRPRVVVIEQVKGFGSHSHKQQVLDCLKHVGYSLRWCRVLDASQFGGSTRSRWLGLATRIHDTGISFEHMQMWPAVSQLTPQGLGAILSHDMLDMHQLQITEDMKQCGSAFSMLPAFEKSKMRWATPSQIWASRCNPPTVLAKTFMSRYGQQHQLEVRMLEDKGYLGHFLAVIDHEGRCVQRLHHPLEIMMIHLTVDSGFVAKDYRESWVQVGNCICLPHALLLLANAVSCFDQHDVDVADLFRVLQHEHLSSSNLVELQHDLGSLFVDPRMISMTQQTGLTHKLDMMKQLCDGFFNGGLQSGWVWTPQHGLISHQQWTGESDHPPQASQITQDDGDTVDVTATAAFTPVVKAEMQLADQRFFVWINGDISQAALCELFHLPLQVNSALNNDLGLSFVLVASTTVNVINAPWLSRQGYSFGLLPLVQRDSLTIVLLDPTKSCDDAAKDLLATLGDGEWFDQFGDVTEHCRITHATAFFPEPLQHLALHTLPCFLLAAQQQIESSAVWNITKACLVFRFQGEETAVKVISQLWSEALVEDTMQLLQQRCQTTDMPGHASLTFAAVGDSFLLPKDTMQECLQIAVVRRIFDAAHVHEGIPITLKWNSRTLWHGQCDSQMTVTVMLALLEPVFQPFLGADAVRLICRGKVWYEVTLEELMRHSNSSSLVFALQFRTAGGAGPGSKETLRTYVKNTVAATLLEQGYPFQWTAETVDRLIDLTGMKFMSQIVSMPQGYARLEQILQACRNSSIVVPERVATEAIRTNSKGTQQMKDQKKRQVVQPDPKQYQLEMTYLQNEDGTTPVQLDEISAQKTGLILVSLNEAMEWIKENRLLTKDELTLAIIGHHRLDTTLTTQTCNLPCHDSNGRAVILATTLCHLGERRIQPTANPQKIDEQVCATVALTLWRDEWADKDWTFALDHTYAFVKQVLAEHAIDSFVESMWGRSIRGENKQRSTSLQAISIQVHLAVQQSKLADFLKVTGFCKLYATPKSGDGRVSADWRVIWTEGDRAHLHALSTQTTGCAGMVRNKSTRGLRYSVSDFAAAWKVIQGDKKMPDDLHIRHLYRIEPLPFGCTAEMLGSWSKILPWPFRAIKALGPKSWLVGSADPPPQGVHCFNSNPVLIKLIQPKGVQEPSPILAGPKPSKQAVQTKEREQAVDPHFDPWAKSAQLRRDATQAAASQTRALQGPIEARFTAQDAKISQMEKALHDLHNNQAQLRAETEKGFAAVEQREQQLHHSIHQVRTDLEQSFKGAITAQSTQLNATLDDLKKLLIKSKRGLSKDEGDMSDS
eukprot:Skav205422  [mRNA]  locus=scaffold582:272322:276983:- [translate_table: standard]